MTADHLAALEAIRAKVAAETGSPLDGLAAAIFADRSRRLAPANRGGGPGGGPGGMSPEQRELAQGVVARVCTVRRVQLTVLRSSANRNSWVADTRRIAAYILRDAGLSLSQIASCVGLSDRGSVAKGIRDVECCSELLGWVERARSGR